MIKVLYVNGDSFAFGQELINTDPADFFKFTDTHRKYSYSGVMADRLNVDLINSARPGASNQRIYRTTMLDLSELLETYAPSEIFVVIGFTNSGRREFFNNEHNEYYDHIPSWKPGHPTDAKLWEFFVRNYSSDSADFKFDQTHILGVQNFIKVNKIPFLFTWAMRNEWLKTLEESNVPKSVLQQRTHQHRWYEESFNMYAHRLDFPYGPEQHPLHEGHQAWANVLLEYISNNNLLDNSDL